MFCTNLILAYEVLSENQGYPMFPDEGFPSSQDVPISLETFEEDNQLMSFLNGQPDLNDCSFHIVSSQIGENTNDSDQLLFANL